MTDFDFGEKIIDLAHVREGRIDELEQSLLLAVSTAMRWKQRAEVAEERCEYLENELSRLQP